MVPVRSATYLQICCAFDDQLQPLAQTETKIYLLDMP
jgi:hypothetical protein